MKKLGLHVAEILPSPGRVKPHVHFVGDEPYLCIFGSGKMNIGEPNKQSDGAYLARWDDKKSITFKQGDVFIVEQGNVHSLANSSNSKSLVIAFICPPSHLDDSKDRTMVANLPTQ